MRTIINSLTKKYSTKSERRFLELLKELHIPFQSKVKIGGREVDFLINKYAFELYCHKQDVNKNNMLVNLGFTPIHLDNKSIGPHLKDWLKKLW